MAMGLDERAALEPREGEALDLAGQELPEGVGLGAQAVGVLVAGQHLDELVAKEGE